MARDEAWPLPSAGSDDDVEFPQLREKWLVYTSLNKAAALNSPMAFRHGSAAQSPRTRMKIAQAIDWETHELPAERDGISIGKMFTCAEMELVRRGYVPEAMEDKWFIYWENNTLYLHRSWTGFCIFVVRFQEEHDGYLMRDADVNQNPEQYSQTSHDENLRLLCTAVDVLLLRLPPEPLPGMDAEKEALKYWALFGRASHGKHPE